MAFLETVAVSFTAIYANCNSDIYTPCTAVTAIPGQTIYAGTYGCCLSVSTTNISPSFQTFTSANCGLADDVINGVYVSASGTDIYVATQPFNQNGGLSVSTTGGGAWTNYTTANGLGSNTVYGVYASGGNIYAAKLQAGYPSLVAEFGPTFQPQLLGLGVILYMAYMCPGVPFSGDCRRVIRL